LAARDQLLDLRVQALLRRVDLAFVERGSNTLGLIGQAACGVEILLAVEDEDVRSLGEPAVHTLRVILREAELLLCDANVERIVRRDLGLRFSEEIDAIARDTARLFTDRIRRERERQRSRRGAHAEVGLPTERDI